LLEFLLQYLVDKFEARVQPLHHYLVAAFLLNTTLTVLNMLIGMWSGNSTNPNSLIKLWLDSFLYILRLINSPNLYLYLVISRFLWYIISPLLK
jgi:hypothetical protein